MTFDKTLDAIMKLDHASKEVLFEILGKRLIDEKRAKIAKNAVLARKELAKGLLKPQRISDVLRELKMDK